MYENYRNKEEQQLHQQFMPYSSAVSSLLIVLFFTSCVIRMIEVFAKLHKVPNSLFSQLPSGWRDINSLWVSNSSQLCITLLRVHSAP